LARLVTVGSGQPKLLNAVPVTDDVPAAEPLCRPQPKEKFTKSSALECDTITVPWKLARAAASAAVNPGSSSKDVLSMAGITTACA
jgi:hypothetical protein